MILFNDAETLKFLNIEKGRCNLKYRAAIFISSANKRSHLIQVRIKEKTLNRNEAIICDQKDMYLILATIKQRKNITAFT